MTIIGSLDDERTVSWYIPLTRITGDGNLEITLIDEIFDYINEQELFLIVFNSI